MPEPTVVSRHRARPHPLLVLVVGVLVIALGYGLGHALGDPGGQARPATVTSAVPAPVAVPASTPRTSITVTNAVPATVVDVPVDLPADFVLPGRDTLAAGTAVTEPVTLLADPCPGASGPDGSAVTASRFYAAEGGLTRGTVVFVDAQAAVDWVNALLADAVACTDGTASPDGSGTDRTAHRWLDGPWAMGLTFLTVHEPAVGAATATYLQVMRVGSAVAVSAAAAAAPAPPYRVDDEVAASLRGPLDEVWPRLCRWTVAGC